MRTSLHRTGPRDVAGWVFDPGDPDRAFLVEILIDGAFHTALRADRRAPDLTGHPHRAFALTLPDDLLAGAHTLEAFVANTSVPVGAPLCLADPFEASVPILNGEVRWLGGLFLSGWSADEGPLVILVDGVAVDRVRPTVWQHLSDQADHDAIVRAFTAHVPERFADGVPHRCAVTTPDGTDLVGSPFTMLAWPDSLERLATDRGAPHRDALRARLFDKLVPGSVPFSDYTAWRERSDDAAVVSGSFPECAVILVGRGDSDATASSLQAQTHPKWLAAEMPASNPVGFTPDKLKAVLQDEAASAPLIVFVLTGTVLDPTALARFCAAFAAHPQAQVAYGDVDLRTEDNSLWPLAFSAFDRERLLEQGYCAHLFAVRREAALRALAHGATDLYGLFMAATPDTAEAARDVAHLPGAIGILPDFDRKAASLVLAASSVSHLGHRGVAATAAAARTATVLPAVRITRSHDRPRVTLMIPTRNRRDLLATCLASIRPAVTRHDAEILLLDNDTSEPEALRLLEELEREGARRIVVPGAFNFARMNNLGASAATGTLLCLLNNDVQAEDADWLDTMIGTMTEPDVGAVAPLLVWPSRVVQHGGLVLGPRFEAAHAFTDRLEDDPGYADLLRVAHECSAVTAACLMTRRRDYLAVGGMDERLFPINFNDVDYCLKLRAAGRRVIFTPHARLIHAESSSRGRAWPEERRRLFERERRALQLKWGAVLADDPYYSPVLALTPQPHAGLSGVERPLSPRLNSFPTAREVPDGF